MQRTQYLKQKKKNNTYVPPRKGCFQRFGAYCMYIKNITSNNLDKRRVNYKHDIIHVLPQT